MKIIDFFDFFSVLALIISGIIIRIKRRTTTNISSNSRSEDVFFQITPRQLMTKLEISKL